MFDLSGQKLGQYELREHLGRGGMAEVYKAFQPGMDRFVAIKVMLGHLANDADFVERFKREARSVGKLRHPHIVQAFDFGIENDLYYMVMEFIEGHNLKAHIFAKRQLALREALTIAGQLSSALDYAHSAGMIHRDLKPANVMFLNDANTHAVLTDFGIARMIGETGLTATGGMVGTPAYMSPEAGRGENTDERADLYALGIIFYEMLTGRAPYDADTPMAVVMKHINAPLPTRQDYGHDVPESVEKIILKSLTKDPADRYQTAGEMGAAIELALMQLDAAKTTMPVMARQPRVAANEDIPTVVEAPPAAPSQETTKLSAPSQRKLPLAAIAGLAALVIVAVVVFVVVLGGSGDEPASTPTAVAAQPTAAPTLRIVSAVAGPPPDPSVDNVVLVSNLSPLLKEMDALLLEGRDDEALAQLDARLAENPDDVDALFARSMLLTVAHGFGETQLADADHIIELEPENPLGYIARSDAFTVYPQYSPEESRLAAQRALELDPENPEVAWRVARFQDEAGLESFARSVDLGVQDYRFVNFAGLYLYELGDFEHAIGYLEQTHQLELPHHEDEYGLYQRRAALMGALLHIGQGMDALELARDLAQTETEAANFADYAAVAFHTQDYDKAREWAETAQALEPGQHTADWVLGLLAWQIDGDFDRAIAHLNAVPDDFFQRYLNRDFNHSIEADRARAYRDAGQLDLALESYAMAAELNYDWAAIREERAAVFVQLGDIESARADLTTALDRSQDEAQRQHLLNLIRELGPTD